MKNRIGHSLKACGLRGLPHTFIHRNQAFCLQRVFKHDFFAATGLYTASNNFSCQSPFNPLVLKIARSDDFLGLPLAWLGQWLCGHEWRILKKLQGIPGTPKIVGRWQRNGLIYYYIDGLSLDQKPVLPDHFFEQLHELVCQIHKKGIIYLDMNKKGNILLGADGKPHLIDYQISCEIPVDIPILGPFLSGIRSVLQLEDFYHIVKHKRRFRRDLMTAEQVRSSKRVSFLIALHRLIARPLTKLRRALLQWLANGDYLDTHDMQCTTPENDPSRWKHKCKNRNKI